MDRQSPPLQHSPAPTGRQPPVRRGCDPGAREARRTTRILPAARTAVPSV